MKRVLISLTAAIVLLLAACGDSDETTSATDTSASPTTTAATTAAADEATDTTEMAGHDHSHDHSHDELVESEAAEPPTLNLEVLEDPMSGWNLHLQTTNYVFAPENVSTAHIDGQGHAHLYIDGEKYGRIYSPWFQVPPLEPGEHTLTVELSANDHRAYAANGVKIEDSVTLTVPGESDQEASAGQMDHMDDMGVPVADISFEVVYSNGTVEGGPQQVEVKLGSMVALTVTSDIDEEIHVHGYDEYLDISAGETTTLLFEARIPGVFEAELEGNGQRLIEFEVS